MILTPLNMFSVNHKIKKTKNKKVSMSRKDIIMKKHNVFYVLIKGISSTPALSQLPRNQVTPGFLCNLLLRSSIPALTKQKKKKKKKKKGTQALTVEQYNISLIICCIN